MQSFVIGQPSVKKAIAETVHESYRMQALGVQTTFPAALRFPE